MDKKYRVRGGLHGVGISAVNYLSSELVAEVRRSGYLWRQTYREGTVITDVEQLRPLNEDESTGMSVTLTPDSKIMDEGLAFDYDLIVERCQELAYLLPQVTFSIEKVSGSEAQIVLNHANGLAAWVADLNQDAASVHPILETQYRHDFLGKDGRYSSVEVHLALQFKQDKEMIVKGFVNTVETVDGGTHIDGLLSGLQDAIYGNEPTQSLDGLVAILQVFHKDPHFESQTVLRLINPEVKDAVMDCVRQLFAENMDVHAQLQGYFRV